MTRQPPKYGFVVDNRKCIGCHACSTACKSENEVPLGVHRTWLRSAEVGTFPDVTRHFQVTRCNHCAAAPCAVICPTSAMHRRADGIVDFAADGCIGCRACLQACPYDAIYIDPETATAAKCNYCAHRTELGLEPACVVVCPEHAILAGDTNDPGSEIAVVLSEQASNLSVRRPEKGTSPQLFYIDGHEVNLRPDPDATLSVPDRVDRPHEPAWRWPVPAYMVTKAIASGTVAVGLLGAIDGFPPKLGLLAAATSLVALLVTTVLLVADLEHPERFLHILERPNWSSWVARGAVVLAGLGVVLAAWLGVELFVATRPFEMSRLVVLSIGFPVGILGAVYTAFLFAQARGRDAWQNWWLPAHLAVQALMAGAATLLILAAVLQVPRLNTQVFLLVFVGSLCLDLAMRFLDHEARESRYGFDYWVSIVFGGFGPLALVMSMNVRGFGLAGAFALVGLFFFERAFVMGPQEARHA